MTELPLHRKYRPQDFSEIIGNQTTIEGLKKKIEEKKTTTFLLQGPRGCGKTTIARIMANKIGAQESDIFEFDLAEVGLKDKAVEIKRQCQYTTLSGGPRVLIFDEIQNSSKTGFQSTILKLLEEPPKNVFFVLCTTDPQKLLKTILSRCSIWQVKLLNNTEIETLIKQVARQERFRINQQETRKIISKSEGNPREALILLDKIITVEDFETRLKILDETTKESEETTIKLCRAINKKDSWKSIAEVLKEIKNEDIEEVRLGVRTYFMKVLLSGTTDAAQVIDCFGEKYMDLPGLVLASYMAVLR